jgi:hypothetical protein
MMTSHLAEPLVAPETWDGSNGIADDLWGMDGNDRYGCCGAAAIDHGKMAKAGKVSLYDHLGRPTYDGTLGTYFAYGIDQGEPGPRPDRGVDNSSWLGFLYRNRIIKGYGEVPLEHVNAYAAAFDGVLLAIRCGDDFQQLFAEGRAWGSTGSDPDPTEGHDIYYVSYGADGSGEVVTWGRTQPITADFIDRYVTDAWVFFGAEDPIVNWDSMRKALDGIHGTVGE